MTMWDQALEAALNERRQQHRYRQRLCIESAQDASLGIDGRTCINFSGNDYLGLAKHPNVCAAMQAATETMGAGSGASHLVCGHSHYHHQLEQALAEFTGRERVLLVSTGYMANLSVISTLLGRGDTVFSDRLNHASLIDAVILSRAKSLRFRHNDCQHLERQLEQGRGRNIVAVDGVFSMDGDLAPLSELSALCEHYDAALMVDDAHGFGVLGEQGGGCADHFALSQQQLPILVGTLGKAFGSFGAFIAGSSTLIETLIQFARPYIYTTALPPAVAAATLASLPLLQKGELRRQLHQVIDRFRCGARTLSLPLMDSITPIQPVMIGDDQKVMALAAQLKKDGILVGAIRPPTVPEGSARLRITLSANHTTQDVDRLLACLDHHVPQPLRRSP